MARVIQGANRHDSLMKLKAAPRFDYKYPAGLDLKPGSEDSLRLRDRLIERANESATFMQSRHSSWNRIDEVLTTYVKASDAETLLQSDDPKKPVSIVFPNTYAILETMLSYMSSSFFTDPLFRYVGVGSEDVVGATLLQKVVQQQCERSKVILNLHTMLRDSFAYGIGAVHPYWKVTHGAKPRVSESLSGESVIEFEQNAILSEGNALMNIDPYLMLPDPNTPLSNLQDGEYFGWVTRTNAANLLSAEQDDADMFNARYLRFLDNCLSTITSDEPSARGKKSGLERSASTSFTRPADVVTLFIRLIPAEWKLGESEYPELWVFELVGDEIILKAQPAGYMHGMLPVAMAAPEDDGYGIAPISKLEIQSGLQHVLDWLFSSHITNVRKSMNDMLVVDPFLVNMKDVENPRPGKLIRLRKPAWGQGVKNAVQQLAVSDVTRGHMNDAGFVIQMMQQLSGSDSPMMGVLRQGGPERLTSAEFQGTMTGSVSRLERIAKLISYQAFHDIGRMFATNTQQLMTRPAWVQSVGDLPETLAREYGRDDRILVDPTSLIVDYDVVVRDGSMPGGNYTDAWVQLFQIIGSNQLLSQRFDVARIFKHIARNLGAKNVEDFENRQIAPQVMSDEQVAREVEKGNLVNNGEL